MDPVHPGEVGLGVLVEHVKTGLAPASAKVDSQPAISGECIANPVGMETVLDDDDDSAVVVEVADRNSMAPPGTTSHRLDDERILACIGRPRDARDDREGGNRVRCSNHGSRESHGLPRRGAQRIGPPPDAAAAKGLLPRLILGANRVGWPEHAAVIGDTA